MGVSSFGLCCAGSILAIPGGYKSEEPVEQIFYPECAVAMVLYLVSFSGIIGSLIFLSLLLQFCGKLDLLSAELLLALFKVEKVFMAITTTT